MLHLALHEDLTTSNSKLTTVCF